MHDFKEAEHRPLVSVIIPVYKVEKYLKECVESVRNQTYTNLEIILVDDGSPDCCGQMCDEFATEDERIHVIHQKNSGVAAARNAGLHCVSGDYVFFVDSDDLVLDNTIEIMLQAADSFCADMVCSDCRDIDENGRYLQAPAVERKPVRMNCDEALQYYAPKEWAPWNRLVKASVHEQIFFPSYAIHEDEAIKFQLLERCHCVVALGAQTYLYRQRASSITGSDSKVDRMDMFYSRSENLNYLKVNHPAVAAHFLPNVCNAALYNLGVLISQENSDTKAHRIGEIVFFTRENYREIIRNPFMTPAQKVRFILIRHSDWSRSHCLYVRFYTLLNKLRGRN